MKLLHISLLAVVLSGCALTADIPEEKLSQIPDSANRIDIITDKTVDDSMADLKAFLDANGFTIKTEDEISKRIETEYKEVSSRTKLRLTMRVIPVPDGSRIESVGAWSTDVEESTFESAGTGVSVEEQNWYPVVWQSTPRANIAYGEMIKLFDTFPANEVKYVKQ